MLLDSKQNFFDSKEFLLTYKSNKLKSVINLLTCMTKEFLKLRKNALDYTFSDMNLRLDNDEQVYIAVFDVPNLSIVPELANQTYVLIFGLNTHIYFENGNHIVGLEKNNEVLQAMQSLLISSSQVLEKMKLVDNYNYYSSDKVRVYLKTKKGVFYKEIENNCKEDKFIMMLFSNLQKAISLAYKN